MLLVVKILITSIIIIIIILIMVMMVCEEDVLNIDPNRTRNAQTMDLAIFRNLAIDFVA